MDHEPTSSPSMAQLSGSEHPVPHPEHNLVAPRPAAGGNYGTPVHGSGAPHPGSTAEPLHVGQLGGYFTATPHHSDLERGPVAPPPAHSYSQDGQRHMPLWRQMVQGGSSTISPPTAARHPSDIDWIVPYGMTSANRPLSEQNRAEQSGAHGVYESRSEHRDVPSQEVQRGLAWLALACMPCKRRKKVKIIEVRQWDSGTLGERLAPTIRYAEEEKERCAETAQCQAYAINIAIGLQVFLGALTTALGAAVTSTKQAQISTAVLGGLSTLVASYLARVRGSGEPELSIMRVKDLEHFIRDCRAFELDHGHEHAAKDYHHCPLNQRLIELRQKFENLLGDANGQRKLSATGVGPTGQEINSAKGTTTGAAPTTQSHA